MKRVHIVGQAIFVLTFTTFAMTLLAQSEEEYSPPPELGTAISIPKPTEAELDGRGYDSPELPDTRAAVGSQLIDGRLPKPQLDYSVVSERALQRLTFFEKGLVVLHITAGDAKLRKRMILPEGVLEEYLALLSSEEIDRLRKEERLTNGLTRDLSFIRIYKDEGDYSEIEFSNSRVLPSSVAQLRATLDELVRILAEDRGTTNPMMGYAPRIGDKLISDDMKLFEITAVSVESEVVEFTGIHDPVRIYVQRDDIPSYFHAILGRQPN